MVKVEKGRPGRPKLISEKNKRILIKLTNKNGRRNILQNITAEWNKETGLNLLR